jgi:hypothetical protein
MDKRLLWIGVVLGLAACGGDDDVTPDPNTASNNTVSGLSNNSTSNAYANNTEADAGSDVVTTDPDQSSHNDTGNNATNNATNNTVATNNSANNITSGVTCMEILQCLLICNTEDTMCMQDCKDTGSPAAHTKIDAYLGCVDTLCADATGVTELTECVLDKCGEQQAACLE